MKKAGPVCVNCGHHASASCAAAGLVYCDAVTWDEVCDMRLMCPCAPCAYADPAAWDTWAASLVENESMRFSARLERYVAILDALRALRATGAPERDKDVLREDLESLDEQLSPVEQEQAAALWWRAWPDKFIEHTGLREKGAMEV